MYHFRMYITTVCALFALGPSVFASSFPEGLISAASPVAVDVLYAIPKPSAAENSVFLNNGSLIVSLASEPSIYRLDVTKPNPQAVLAYAFPGRTAASSITKPSPDTLTVLAGNRSRGAQRQAGHADRQVRGPPWGPAERPHIPARQTEHHARL